MKHVANIFHWTGLFLITIFLFTGCYHDPRPDGSFIEIKLSERLVEVHFDALDEDMRLHDVQDRCLERAAEVTLKSGYFGFRISGIEEWIEPPAFAPKYDLRRTPVGDPHGHHSKGPFVSLMIYMLNKDEMTRSDLDARRVWEHSQLRRQRLGR